MSYKQAKQLSDAGIQASRDLEYNAKTSHDTVSFYNAWAYDYEKDQQKMDYCVPQDLVKFLERVIADNSGVDVTKSSSVIDIAAGTGWVGEILRQRGFIGKIDAVDGSKNMLKMAKKKGVYDGIFVT